MMLMIPKSSIRIPIHKYLLLNQPSFVLRVLSERQAAPEVGPLTGKTYVITGTLSSMTREHATAAIERLGGPGDDGVRCGPARSGSRRSIT